jgi:hypothetical protein
LECCGVPYRYAEYTPALSEPGLRLRLRQWSSAVSMMFTASGILRGSWEIASHAAGCAGDDRLGELPVVAQWNAISEAALAKGRTRVVKCVL